MDKALHHPAVNSAFCICYCSTGMTLKERTFWQLEGSESMLMVAQLEHIAVDWIKVRLTSNRNPHHSGTNTCFKETPQAILRVFMCHSISTEDES